MMPMKKRRVASVVFLSGASLAAFTLAAAPLCAQSYELPFFADDLDTRERFFTRDHKVSTTQKFGYDIGVYRLNDDGAWESLTVSDEVHWREPRNQNYRIYGKPFYAMRDGVVMGCWRNAPENPRPKFPSEDADTIPLEKRDWLHLSLRFGRMPGGGNELWIKHDDGTYALYAHAKTGSIPISICPKTDSVFAAQVPDTATLLDGIVSPPVQVTPLRRKRVKQGDFLGLMGNSGSSTNPHIHIHVQRSDRRGNWEGVPIRFGHGLSTPWADGKAGLEGWKSFGGETIPRGSVLFWAPIRLSKEYASHGVAAADLQLQFTHLAGSGFMPEILDCYSVGGKVFYNMVWRPETISWRAHFGMTESTIEDKFNDAKSAGEHPVYIDSCSSSGGPRYVAIFQKTGGPYRWRGGISPETHDEVFKQAAAEGLSPVNVSVISRGGRRFYTELYRKVDHGGYQLKSQLDEADYQQAVNENKAAGRTPVYLAVYMHGGRPNFSAIFANKPVGSWIARHDLSPSAYQSEWTSATRAGSLTRTVSGYDGAERTHKFAAVWRK